MRQPRQTIWRAPKAPFRSMVRSGSAAIVGFRLPGAGGTVDRGRLIGFASVRDGMAAALTVILAAAWFGTTAAGSAAASSRTPGSCDPTWHVVHPPNPGPFYNELNDITGTSSTDLWTVGWYTNVSNGSSLTLAEHWDGTQWMAIPTPTPGDRGELASVAAIAPDDVWAVGETFRQSPDLYPRSLVEHWDGSAWSVVTLSGATIRGGLLSVFALSASDVWAVGFAGSQTHQRTNILHWDGSTWSRVPAPSPGAGGALRDIHGLGPNDLWAVGISGPGTLTEHWDGSSWTSVPVPNPGYYIDGLHAVAEVAPNDAWAGGMSEGNNNGLEW